jgi:hypothetical protein
MLIKIEKVGGKANGKSHKIERICLCFCYTDKMKIMQHKANENEANLL